MNDFNTNIFGVTLGECDKYYVVVDIDIKSDLNGFESIKKIPDYCHDDLKETFVYTVTITDAKLHKATHH